MTITLYNSKTRGKEVFQPIDPKDVRMYVCGPTVYDRAHIGNARPAIVFDVLFRLLRHVYGPDHVTYVRNFTDVDDKINAKAAATGRSIADICDETIGWYLQDMDAVGVMRPTHMPRATQYIGQMLAMIEKLITSGHAYAANGHVLFRVRSYQNYGALSGRSVDDMIAGARVEIAPFKEDPLDFVLWKPSDGETPGWNSPWGYGRPGWHIECSAMAQDLLGESFDIHGGGLDLQFPHHENELAQSHCAHPHGEFARVWMHNEMLQVEGKKMSKSLGNFFTVRDLLDKGVAGEVIRFVMLSTHYRKPMDWTEAKAEQAQKTLNDWAFILIVAGYSSDMVKILKEGNAWVPDQRIVDSLSNDLNTAGAISVLHEMDKQGRAVQLASFAASLDILGLITDWDGLHLLSNVGVSSVGDSEHQSRVAALLLKRDEAKKLRNFELADHIRDALLSSGVKITDHKSQPTSFEITPTFDPTKLDGLL